MLRILRGEIVPLDFFMDLEEQAGGRGECRSMIRESISARGTSKNSSSRSCEGSPLHGPGDTLLGLKPPPPTFHLLENAENPYLALLHVINND